MAAPERVLRAVAALSPGLSLRRAWPRGPDHLLLEYVTAKGRVVAGQWIADGERLAEVARATSLARSAPARGGATVAAAAGEVLVLLQGGVDRRLTHLSTVVRQPGASLVGHRAERRAVVRIANGAAPRYTKLLSPRAATRAAEALRAVERAAGGSFVTPRLLEHDATSGAVTLSGVPGVPLGKLLGADAAIPAAHGAGQALRLLHDGPSAGDATVHGPAEEMRVVHRWIDRLRPYAPRFADSAAEVAERVARNLGGSPAQMAPVHRDLHDKHLLYDGSRTGMLDFDTLSVGEPAVDLANLLVHLELRALQGDCSRESSAAAARALLEGYGAGDREYARVCPYADATRLRLACLYAFRPRWNGVPEALIGRIGRPWPGQPVRML